MKKDYIVGLREEEADELMDGHWVGELVRCKDCKYGKAHSETGYFICMKAFGEKIIHEPHWFCADGVKR